MKIEHEHTKYYLPITTTSTHIHVTEAGREELILRGDIIVTSHTFIGPSSASGTARHGGLCFGRRLRLRCEESIDDIVLFKGSVEISRLKDCAWWTAEPQDVPLSKRRIPLDFLIGKCKATTNEIDSGKEIF